MNILTRWEPFRKTRRMHDMLDGIMDKVLMDIPRFGGLMSGIVPVDVYQTDDDVVVKATMPRVKPEDINISITGESLTLPKVEEVKPKKITVKTK